jgi:hypothetical protein
MGLDAIARVSPHAQLARRAGRTFDDLLRTHHLGIILALVSLNLGLTLFTGLVTLRDYPASADEYSYLISAQLFSEGRLWVPSPEPREFFDFFHVINDGRYYGKYPPGWPLILSLGVLVKTPWLVNPVLAMLTLLLIYRIARENFSQEAANVSLFAAAVNPLLIFNSASYYAHPSGLLFMTLFAYAALRCLKEPGIRLPYVLMAISFGAAFLIRPYTAGAVALPFVAWLLVNSVRTNQFPELLKGLALSAVPFAIAFIAFVSYNTLQTGQPLLQPYSHYNPLDTPFHLRWGWRKLLYSNGYTPLKELTQWIPLSVPLLILFFVSRQTRRDSRAVLLLAGFLSLLIAYFFYHASPRIRYGPRYLYEASFVVFILMGCVIVRWKRFAMVMLPVILCLNTYVFLTSTSFYGARVRAWMNVYDLAEKHQLSNAIVFLRTASGGTDRRDLTRNGIHFDGPVLYVHDLGARNPELLRAFPGRQAYVYEDELGTGNGRLTPYRR